MNDVISHYRACGSIKECAYKFGLSEQKTRRILLIAGEFSSHLSRQISTLHEKGMSPAEIADVLHVRKKTVQSYLPYSKGQYNSEAPTVNAQRIRACRERKTRKGT